MNEKSTEQELREALQGLLTCFTVEGFQKWSYIDTLETARKAFALPDSGDHRLAEILRAARSVVSSIPPADSTGEPSPPPPDRIEVLARDLWGAFIGVWPTLPWGDLDKTRKQQLQEVTRRFLAKHPSIARTEVSPSLAQDTP